MLDNKIVDMNYWDFKKLCESRSYPLYYEEDAKTFTLMIFERHRGYRTRIIKEGFQDNFDVSLTKQEISDIYEDFIAIDGLKDNGRLVNKLIDEIAVNINNNTYKYMADTSNNLTIESGVAHTVLFEGKCKSIWFVASVDVRFRIGEGDWIEIKQGAEYQLEFDYKLINPAFIFEAQSSSYSEDEDEDNNNDGTLKYFIDGEVL